MLLLKVITLIGFLHFINALRSYTIEIRTYNETFSSEFYSLHTFQLIEVDGRRVINGSAVTARDIETTTMKIKASALAGIRTKAFTLLDYSTELCKGNKGINIFPRIVKNILYSVKNLKHFQNSCPYKKGIDYYIKNFYADAEMFPPYLPEMALKINFKLLLRNFTFYESNTTVAVKSKRSKMTKTK